MSDVEKLRALLAEAVPLNTPCPSCLRSIEEERRGYGRAECADTALRLRVDAALASQPIAEHPADHLAKCGPLCPHVTFCGNCTNIYSVCKEHRGDPRAAVFWKTGSPP